MHLRGVTSPRMTPLSTSSKQNSGRFTSIRHGRCNPLERTKSRFAYKAILVLGLFRERRQGRFSQGAYTAERLDDGLEKPAPRFTSLQLVDSLFFEQIDQYWDNNLRSF